MSATNASASPSSFPKAVLYTASVSVWGSVPRLVFLEKGYHDEDYETRDVNLIEAENFAPSYLRINAKGTVPSLVVPLAETTGQEVDTKFRALGDSIEIAEFLDASRSQPILESKGEEKASKPAPVLSPATIEGKASSDDLIKLVQNPRSDPNALLLAARTLEELQAQRKGLQGTFCRNRQNALERYKSEASANADAENPRTAHVTERLVKWYTDKLNELTPLHAAYLSSDAQAAQAFLASSQSIWAGTAATLVEIEQRLVMPFALGDQVSLADLHLTAYLARIFSVATAIEGEQEEIAAMNKALRHPILQADPNAQKGVGEKLKVFWAAMKDRPSFKTVYADGLH